MPEYNIDFFAWTREQSALIRARRWSEIDVEHLADEIEDMGKSEKGALESRLEILLMHLLNPPGKSPGYAGVTVEV